MQVILLGLFGLALLFIYDIVSLYRVPSRGGLAFLGYALHTLAIFAAAWAGEKAAFPAAPLWPRVIGALLALLGGGWLVYCLFLFPSLARTYQDPAGPAFTRAGPYAFSRHPGFIGHLALLGGLLLASRSLLLLRAAGVWVPANLAYVVLQDRVLFPRLFREYGAYRAETPFILPTAASLQRFWATRWQ
ncbi:methyltransferase [Gelria sp. Kuro-4]|uniref:methyltransferase n=1 Tax=Gelria sp. Kuro-4 TaxID=2796927 RepID=UPI001BF0AFD0|nr:methyltransferase [Gelria sp. Kuro-4]BCV23826.1 hypothetical protein kuro4_05990 [Gelria sp. Kuro-4]